MLMKKAISMILFFFFYTSGFSLTIQVIDKNAEQIKETVTKILAIQKSLLLSLEISAIPSYAQSGFLTIQMTPQYLLNFLRTGKFLIAVHQDQVVGYLLLDQIEQYLNWAEGKQFKSEWNLKSFQNLQYIDQIAVDRKFMRQGIGTALVNCAKKLSAEGLLTDILFTPYHNHASMQFFTTNEFLDIGTMHIEKTAMYPPHATSVMLWLPDAGRCRGSKF